MHYLLQLTVGSKSFMHDRYLFVTYLTGSLFFPVLLLPKPNIRTYNALPYVNASYLSAVSLQS